MKTHLLLALALLASCDTAQQDNENSAASSLEAPAGTPVVIDEKNGFRELHFGQERSSITDLVALPGRDYVAIKDYEKKPGLEKLQVGNAEIRDITYGFQDDKLVRVTLSASGENTDKLLNAAIGLYGTPVQDNKVMPPGRAYWWMGEKVIGSYQETGREGKLGYLVLTDKQATLPADKPTNAEGAADL